MCQLKNIDDTIAAISTPMGQGGIGIVRISGEDTLAIIEKVFRPKNKKNIGALKSFTAHYGWIVAHKGSVQEEMIDEVLVTIMRAPKSYTKEDVAEISCHGGVVSIKAILNSVTDAGARLAEPGEFTKRAFLNGRIDLAQAEAVLDIIQSKTNAFLKISTNQLKGELSLELEAIREQLMTVYIEVEAFVNFPEDDMDAQGKLKLVDEIDAAKQKVDRLLSTADEGRILKEGIKIVLCGKPNTGKSSLLNVLLKTPRAIVSEIKGTTRDTIEETAQISGVPFNLVDTAGILEPRDMIEQEAVKRSRMCIESADLVLFIIDGSEPLDEEDQKLMKGIKDQDVLVVINKSDLGRKADERKVKEYLPGKETVSVSAISKTGIPELEKKMVECVLHGKMVDMHGALVSNLRHINALKGCQNFLESAKSILKEGTSLEFVSEEIKQATNCLDSITGRNIDADLLDQIFSQFCIGK